MGPGVVPGGVPGGIPLILGCRVDPGGPGRGADPSHTRQVAAQASALSITSDNLEIEMKLTQMLLLLELLPLLLPLVKLP